MKIAFNSLPTRKEMTGSCRYYRNIIREITKLRPDYQIVNWVNAENEINYGFKNQNYSQHLKGTWCANRNLRILYESFFLGPAINKEKPDFFHGNGFIPVGLNAPAIVTIHDMSYFSQPDRTTSLRSRYFRAFTRNAALKAEAIITVSHFSARDIVKYLPFTEGKIHVIPNGIESWFKPVEDEKQIMLIRKKYGLKNRFFLYVGTLEPGKNIVRLIKAYEKLIKSKNTDIDLVLAGKKGWLFEDIFKTAKDTGLMNKKIFFPDYVPEGDLPVLYSAAECFVFPSLNEGFGLPPVEAMSCGTPVITSNTSSLPEVVGDAGIMVNPLDENELSEAMERVSSDETLRKQMIASGLRHARQYTWENTARSIIKVYEKIFALKITGNIHKEF